MSTRSELDFHLLAGVPSPGLAKFSGLSREQTWDVKDADGQTGGSTTHKGSKLIKFSVVYSFGIDVDTGLDDFDQWPAFERLINSTIAGPKVFALELYYVEAARLVPPLTAVSLAKMGTPVQDGLGGRSVTVDYIEYQPAKAKSSSASRFCSS